MVMMVMHTAHNSFRDTMGGVDHYGMIILLPFLTALSLHTRPLIQDPFLLSLPHQEHDEA